MIVMWKSSLHLFWINCPEENKQEKDLEGIERSIRIRQEYDYNFSQW